MLVQQLVNGLTIGSVYALVAIGYSLVFGVLRLINFSHGSLYMLGAFLMLIFYSTFKGLVLPAIILSVILTGCAGFLVDYVALRPLRVRNAPRMAGLISTLGFGTLVDNGIQIWIGTETRPFPNFLNFGKFYIGTAVISYTQVIIFVLCITLMLLLSFVVYKTKVGKSMRAVAQNETCAKLMGINVRLVISATFTVGAILACVSGILVGAYYQNIDTTMGFSVGMKTFAAAVLGGVGSLPGAMLGGIIVGMAETIGASYISSGYRDAIAFAILIIVLLVKPSGIFGKATSTKM